MSDGNAARGRGFRHKPIYSAIVSCGMHLIDRRSAIGRKPFELEALKLKLAAAQLAGHRLKVKGTNERLT